MANYAAWAARWRVRLQFLLVVPVLWFARPSPRLLGAGALLVLLGLAVRAWAAGHLRRDQPLTMSGPYAHLRHPLYFGSALILVGFALGGGHPSFGPLLLSYFGIFFVPVMQREELERLRRAPALFYAYIAKVPMFIPRLRAADFPEQSNIRFDTRLYWRNREWRAEVGCALLLTVLYLKMVLL